MSTSNPPIRWSLEIVRGRELGRVYALNSGEIIVGNALNGEQGLDLSDQEASSTRRMAARHAALMCTPREITIRDLESPGGTFVNRQRLLSGQSRRLEAGDVIQLGGIQLRLKNETAKPAAASIPSRTTNDAKRPAVGAASAAIPAVASGPASTISPTTARSTPAANSPATAGRLSIPFTMAGGLSCRSWNDFLVLAAQHWGPLRDELSTGRLAEYLRRIGRLDLVPALEKNRSADDQLDAWLARLPVDQSSAPELDVHPESITIRAATGGGSTRQTLRVTNVGYRLLRSTARIEPTGTPWLRLLPVHGRPFSTIDQSDLPVELDLPESIDRPLSAAIVIDSNGGTKRIAVRIERPTDEVLFAEPSTAASASSMPEVGQHLQGLVASMRPGARMALACAGAIGMRVLIMLINAVIAGGRGAALVETRLSSVVLLLVGVGFLLGLWLASRRGEGRDLPAAALAGGLLGLTAAAIVFAAIQTTEGLLGSWSSSLWAVGLLWAGLGAAAALISILVIPHSPIDPETAR